MLSKNLHNCFSKLQRTSSFNTDYPTSLDANNKDHNHHHSSPTTTTTTTTCSLSPSSSISMIKNFNSLYDLTPDHHSSTSKSISHSSDDNFFSSSSDSDITDTSPPDFATVFASQRFFFSSPGRTNSIVESSLPESPPPSPPPPESDALIAGEAAVLIPTISPDPYMDFRQSMQEMVEARDLIIDVKEDWDYLNELLSCYLTLNPKNTHKFIIGAFADLLVSLTTTTKTASKSNGARRNHDISGQCNVSRQLV